MLEGRVKVDGKTITELGSKFSTDCKIEINGKILLETTIKKYYIFYKPRCVVTTMFDPKKRKTVADFFKKEKIRLFPVGRLDYDVSGLLIMTNDGDFANYISHPRYNFNKTYQALCDGEVSKQQITNLLSGVIIEDNYKAKANAAKIISYDSKLNQSLISLTINEGHKHHVKNMLKSAFIELIKLKRTNIDILDLGNLKPGEFRSITKEELSKLFGKIKIQNIGEKQKWE